MNDPVRPNSHTVERCVRALVFKHSLPSLMDRGVEHKRPKDATLIICAVSENKKGGGRGARGEGRRVKGEG